MSEATTLVEVKPVEEFRLYTALKAHGAGAMSPADHITEANRVLREQEGKIVRGGVIDGTCVTVLLCASSHFQSHLMGARSRDTFFNIVEEAQNNWRMMTTQNKVQSDFAKRVETATANVF